MIRSFIRCTKMYKNLFAYQSNYIISAQHPISSAVGQTKFRNKRNSHLVQDPTTEESIPLHIDRESMANFINILRNKLDCPKEEATKLCIEYPDLIDRKFSDATKNLELLVESGVRPTVILNNPRMLTRNHSKIGSIVRETQFA